jgi:hypothetical protein
MKKKTLLMVLLCGACFGALQGQTISLSGTVTNTAGQPLSGVVVQLLAEQLKDTTLADGQYSFSGPNTPVMQRAGQRAGKSDLSFRNNRFVFKASSPVVASVKLYALNGRLVSTVCDGTFKQGVTEIPLDAGRLGRATYLMTVKSNGCTESYRLSLCAGQRSVVSGMSTENTGRLTKTAATVDWLQAVKQGYSSHLEQLTATTGVVNITLSAPGAAPSFGPNVYIFDPATPTATMQGQATTIFNQMQSNQFGSQRYAILLKPGAYSLDINVGFYTEVLGLGLSPDSVVVNGSVHSESDWMGGNGTCNFWRSAAGMCIVPPTGTTRWAVSQAAPYRRMHVKGNLDIANNSGSGGFIADSKVDGTIGQWQQQWLSRNSQYGKWSSTGWNFVFVGNVNPPAGTWPNPPYTVVPKTPIIREKPFLYIDNTGSYSVMVQDLRKDSTIGMTWTNGPITGTSVPIDLFYIAHATTDNAASINAALALGKNLLLTPGIYNLEASIKVTRPQTIVLGIGMPSLMPQTGTPALEASDVDGLKIGGFIVDASTTNSENLVVIGEAGSALDHSANPTSLWDIFCSVGGEFSGQATCMMTINSNNVICDDFWLWRADHGTGAGWTANKNQSGLVVNGNYVTAYGLFVEHTQQYQTLWNGNFGRTYLYQSELPYDMPNEASWKTATGNGWASYKVAATVTNHESWAPGVYAAIHTSGISADNAFEVPVNAPGIKMHNLLTVGLSSNIGTITHIINGVGASANPGNGSSNEARLAAYP